MASTIGKMPPNGIWGNEMKFCQRCYDVLAQNWAKKAKYDPRYKLDVKKMVFPCQVPIYEPDSMTGTPMVKIWNCKTQLVERYSIKEYNAKKARGEFE